MYAYAIYNTRTLNHKLYYPIHKSLCEKRDSVIIIP